VSILYEALQKTQEEGYGQSMVLPQDDMTRDEKIAMVDNRFFSIGDNIDDMTIVSIEQDNIKLKSNSGMVELHLAV
jgi:hypothetical protein